MIQLSDRDLNDFEELIPWIRPSLLADGRVLGEKAKTVNNELKRVANEHIGNDARLSKLFAATDLTDKRVIELGSLECHNSVDISRLCKELVAVEVRPRNVINALVRLFVHDTKNVTLLMKDARELDEFNGQFDTLFHAGLLYHMENPVEHLWSIHKLAPELLLDTSYATADAGFPRSDIEYGGKTYEAFLYKEHGWADPLSGVDDISRWITPDALLRLLADIGYDDVAVISDVDRGRGCGLVTIRAVKTAEVRVQSKKSAESGAASNRFVVEAQAAAKAALELRKELAAKEEKIKELERQISDMTKHSKAVEESTTWRVGRMFTAPAAALKGKLKT